MSIFKTITAFTAAATLSACADAPEAVAPAYVSSGIFAEYSCSALNAEAQIISRQLAAATGRQQAAADNDATMTAVSLILFWPAVFWIGNNDGSAELAQIKGTAEAIRGAAVRKGC
jgi:hypothetical protein